MNIYAIGKPAPHYSIRLKIKAMISYTYYTNEKIEVIE